MRRRQVYGEAAHYYLIYWRDDNRKQGDDTINRQNMLNFLISGENIAKPGDLEIRCKVGSFPAKLGELAGLHVYV